MSGLESTERENCICSSIEPRPVALQLWQLALDATAYMDARRAERVSEAVREELAEIIGFEMEDPRLPAWR